MGELVFDVIRPNAQDFIQNRPCDRPEAMPAHFILVDSSPSHGGENCVVAHWSLIAPRTRKHKTAVARERLEFAQDFYSLT